MATIILQAAGAYLGGLIGATAATIGTAAGAVAGYLLDQALLNSATRIEGPRLASAPPLTAEDGSPVPRLYGTARLGATLIWATRFEEVRTTERRGAKGGPKVTTYAYYANAAFALCEGEIAGIRRVWADGRELDLDGIDMRVHRGTADQLPDPLIEAKQGEGNTPAYRGIAYVVFERLALDDYGNRLPQLQFEVIRPVGGLTRTVKAVALIPGSTEFGYAPLGATQAIAEGQAGALNRHVLFGASDFAASVDELQAVCPNLKHVALVVAWFGDDLRAGTCTVRPKVVGGGAAATGTAWRVSDVEGADAGTVSEDGGQAAFGGTPSDASVIDAIQDLKARGLSVTLYPFVMMDVPAGNTLPDPYGGAGQAAYPWRGRITCHPAAGQTDSADRTPAARTQAAAYFGEALAADFSSGGGQVHFSGPADEWGYRRMILHYARVAQEAGGVDAFLIGSELRGLTTIRDEADAFPAVEALCALAADVRAMLGSGPKLTYAADWSEYFGHQPGDGSGDVFFHLDALWAHSAIDAIGIDNYMPLSDWRDGDYAGESPDGAAGPYDLSALRAAIVGGEGYDWFYADEEARNDRMRSPIADSAHGKPWVFRYKDLVNWWSNAHFDRPGGVESATPTDWIARSKPIWFTELGCPACDKGPNQPNVFHDPKSAESALPRFSNGGRSDIAQHRFIEAHLGYWDEDSDGFEDASNPVSGEYDGRMLDAERCYLWAWDARPFPAFPLATDIWGDGENWPLGHWLNGRLASPAVGDLINAIIADHGLEQADVEAADGKVTGYVVSEPSTARGALEQIAEVFGLVACVDGDRLIFRSQSAGAGAALEIGELAAIDARPVITSAREAVHLLPDEALLSFRDPLRDYRAGSTRHVHPNSLAGRQQSLALSGCLEEPVAQSLVADWLKRRWRAREQVSFAIPASDRRIAPGSIIRLPERLDGQDYLVTGIEEGLVREISALRIDRLPPTPAAATLGGAAAKKVEPPAKPLVHFLDLPSAGGTDQPWNELRIAAWCRPWRNQIVYASPETAGFEQRAALVEASRIGKLEEAVVAGNAGRIDAGRSLLVRIFGGALSSVSTVQMMNGANAAALRSASGAWEVLQFMEAEEIASGLWRLSKLLRGQLGTEDAMLAGAPLGSAFVMLDQAVPSAGLRPSEAGLPLTWRVGLAKGDLGGALFDVQTVTGGVRAALPLSPVHIRANKAASGDVSLRWIRRGRIAADGWEAGDIPLGEETEAYAIEVRTEGDVLLRSAEMSSPEWTYGAGDIAEDFDGDPGPAIFHVFQKKGAAGSAGLPGRLSFYLA